MHGWAGDSKNWMEWKRYFQKNGWHWQSIERGYGLIKSTTPKWINSRKTSLHQKRALICHSLGIHLIDTSTLKKATDIVLLNSFGRFIPNARSSYPLKVALRGMHQCLGTSKEKNMLRKFLEKANKPHQINELQSGLIKKGISVSGREKLISDLELLIHTNGLPSGISRKSRVLAIVGEKDEIVNPLTSQLLLDELIAHLQIKPTHWRISNEGHSILMPQLINQVGNWLEEYQ